MTLLSKNFVKVLKVEGEKKKKKPFVRQTAAGKALELVNQANEKQL